MTASPIDEIRPSAPCSSSRRSSRRCRRRRSTSESARFSIPTRCSCISARSRRARRSPLSSARGWSTTGRPPACRSSIPQTAAVRPDIYRHLGLTGDTCGLQALSAPAARFFGLVQAFVCLTFGAPTSGNVEAVQILSQGWLTDMYADRVYNEQTRTGIYGDPGPAGPECDRHPDRRRSRPGLRSARSDACAVLDRAVHCWDHSTDQRPMTTSPARPTPRPPARLSRVRRHRKRTINENSLPNTALSLDGRASTGQSVGQHVCEV